MYATENRFVALENAKDVIRALVPIVEVLRMRSSDLADQIERAGTSMVLNIAEGRRRSGRDKQRFYAMAHGSAGEIRAVLDIAELWGCRIDPTDVASLLDRELRLLWGLVHPKPKPV